MEEIIQRGFQCSKEADRGLGREQGRGGQSSTMRKEILPVLWAVQAMQGYNMFRAAWDSLYQAVEGGDNHTAVIMGKLPPPLQNTYIESVPLKRIIQTSKYYLNCYVFFGGAHAVNDS